MNSWSVCSITLVSFSAISQTKLLLLHFYSCSFLLFISPTIMFSFPPAILVRLPHHHISFSSNHPDPSLSYRPGRFSPLSSQSVFPHIPSFHGVEISSQFLLTFQTCFLNFSFWQFFISRGLWWQRGLAGFESLGVQMV